MIILFDLDYTLLDLDALKTGLAEAMGMSRQDWLKSYGVNFRAGGINYNLDKHLKLLGKIDDAVIKKNLAEFINNFDQYLYDGAEALLKRLKPGNKLVMLTRGDKKWQKLKMENLKIKKYFEEIYYVEKSKNELTGLFKKYNGEVIIVNDNAQETKELIKIFGKKAKVFLLASPYSNNIKHQWRIYKLKQLLKCYKTL